VFQLFGGPIIKAFFLSNVARPVRWRQRSIERLRQTLRYLRRLLAVDRPPEALALIPIRGRAAAWHPPATPTRLARLTARRNPADF